MTARSNAAELWQCAGWRPWTSDDALMCGALLGFVAVTFSAVGFVLGLRVLRGWFR